MRSRLAYTLMALVCGSSGYAQQPVAKPAGAGDLQQRVQNLEAEVAELEQLVKQLRAGVPDPPGTRSVLRCLRRCPG